MWATASAMWKKAPTARCGCWKTPIPAGCSTSCRNRLQREGRVRWLSLRFSFATGKPGKSRKPSAPAFVERDSAADGGTLPVKDR